MCHPNIQQQLVKRKKEVIVQEVAPRADESIQRCIATLTHACKCTDITCTSSSCNKMKRVIHHAKMCSRRPACYICKQVIALCQYHANACTVRNCTVPLCQNIRETMATLRAGGGGASTNTATGEVPATPE